MARRANSEGSVYQRASDGMWCGSVTLPDKGRRVVYARTQREALAKLRQLQQALEEGLALRPGRNMTVGAFLSHWVSETLPARVAAGLLRPSTLASYRDQVRLYLVPDLGDIPLARLTPSDVRTWMTMRLREPGRRGQPLSARSVSYLHAVLRKALADAVRDELVTRNVCLLVEPPRGPRKAGSALSQEDVLKVLEKAAGHRLRPLWVLMIGLGLRKGEALAIHWEDVDLEAGTVRIHRTLQRLRDADPDLVTGRRKGRLVLATTTKTDDDTVLNLPAFVIQELEQHRRRQLKDRLAAQVWINPDLVFSTNVGTPLEPRNVNRAWAALCTAAEVSPVRVHDLRHTAGSLLLEKGVDMKVIQKVLRHTRLSTTADIYAHVSKPMERAAADKMDSVFRGLTGAP